MSGPQIHTLDPSLLASWLEIRPDNTIAVRTGVGDFGQGSVSTGFRQIVAEELRVPFDAVSELLTGDTDRTPDGGVSANAFSKRSHRLLLGEEGVHPDSPFGRSGLNLQKVAAYAYQALLGRASCALGVVREVLTAHDGAFWDGSRSVTYAELVRDKPLEVKVPVTGTLDNWGIVVLGEPPIVPVSDYRVIGTSAPNPRIPQIVQGAPTWIGDVKVPGMLHARVVHPPSLGSTLIQVGRLDPAAHPTAQIVVRGSLVGVVAETEWEAIRAAEALAQNTEWRDWNGLPGSDSLIAAMVEMDWSDGPTSTTSPDQEAMEAAFSSAPTKLSATYALPYYKHAPIGPEITVADVPSDGSIRIWTSTQRPQTLRTKIAAMLETEPTNVVVRFVEGAASFGRTNRGDGGAEAEAVLISQACGRPVRLQWSHEDDFGWAKQQAPYLGEVSVGLDEKGRMATFRAEHYLLGANDTRMLGALLAGTPAPLKPSFISELCVEWPYDRVLGHLELGHSTTNLGQRGSPLSVGLQHQSMRSPQHLQQNFGVECMVSEAAAAAGADPIQYRIDHTTDSRLISVLEGVRDMSGWKSRPSPASSARDSGGGVVRGRGVGVAIRKGGYLAAVAEISVDLGTGAICVDRYWLAADVGVVVNPRLLLLNLEGGSAFGISQALREELKFDSRSITSRDFRSYPILTMAEMPELEVKILPPGDTMTAGEASEPANMVPLVALAGAFFDATGKTMRRLPMRPEYVLAELRGS